MVLFCALLPWSPSRVDRNKKKCLWKLFLFPSHKSCVFFSSSVQSFFLATLLVTNIFCCNATLRAVVENNLGSYHLPRALLAVILSNGNTYFTWVCTWTEVLCLSTFPEAELESMLKCMCGLWVIVLQKKPSRDKIQPGLSSVQKIGVVFEASTL